MAFVSELIGKVVTDVDGERVGTLKDLLAVMLVKNTHPQITSIVVKGRSADRIISIEDVAVLIAPGIPLKVRLENLGRIHQPRMTCG